MTLTLILTIIGGLILGIIVAIINTLISKKAMTSEKSSVAMGVNAIRFVLDIAALALAFFICKFAGLNMIAGLISTAFGLTICGMLFLILMTKKASKEMAAKSQEILASQAQEGSETTAVCAAETENVKEE